MQATTRIGTLIQPAIVLFFFSVALKVSVHARAHPKENQDGLSVAEGRLITERHRLIL